MIPTKEPAPQIVDAQGRRVHGVLRHVPPDHLRRCNTLTYRICRPDCLQTTDYEHGP